MKHTIEQMIEQNAGALDPISPCSLADIYTSLAPPSPSLISVTAITGADLLLARLDALEKGNQELKSEVDRLSKELSEIKDSLEYKTWCSEGMPGLIKPQEPNSVFRCGMAVKIVSATGPNADSWNHVGGLSLGTLGVIMGYSSGAGDIRYEVNGFLIDSCDLQELNGAPWNLKGARVKLLHSREKKYYIGSVGGAVLDTRISAKGENQCLVSDSNSNGIWIDTCDLKVIPEHK